VSLTVEINDVALCLGQAVEEAALRRAGLCRVAAWRRWLCGGAGTGTPWTARDPWVVCFEGAVEIYPCRHGYLDPDRQWGTASTVHVDGDMVRQLEIRVIDGKYAAGNLFDRFVEACATRIGAPQLQENGLVAWRPGGWRVEARFASDLRNASFLIAPDTR
jgi:hypothetical protein